MKNFVAFTILIAALLAFSVCAFGSPPTSTKEKPAAVKTTPVASITQAVTVIAKIDASLAMPVEQISIAGEVSKAQRFERRIDRSPDSLYDSWISDVDTPPNEVTFHGFANTRAREQV